MARSAEEQKKSNDRAYDRKVRQKLSERPAGGMDVKTGEKYAIQVLDRDGTHTKKRAPVVQENLKLLRPKAEEEVEEEAMKRRVRYASMVAHMEVAAAVIAAGGTTTLAARKAGVSKRQIRKYMESASFRERIQELQETLGNRIRGRVIKEVERRTSPQVIQKMELLDLLRVGDRFGLGRGSGNNINIHQETHNYESTFAAVVLSDREEEGEDFPTYEPSDFSLPGGNPPE